jgi:hypothetical protein
MSAGQSMARALPFLETSGEAVAMTSVDELGQVEGLEEELHLARLDLGNVQHVVDQAEQVAGGVEHLVQILGARRLAVVGGVLLHDLAVADDGVERGAELVAHLGEEAALGLAGLLGVLHGLGQQAGAVVHAGLQGAVGLLQLVVGLGDLFMRILGRHTGAFQLGGVGLDGVQHGVERFDQVADLAAGRRLHPGAVIPVALHGGGDAGQGGDGPGDAALEAPGHGRRQQPGGEEDDEGAAQEVGEAILIVLVQFRLEVEGAHCRVPPLMGVQRTPRWLTSSSRVMRGVGGMTSVRPLRTYRARILPSAEYTAAAVICPSTPRVLNCRSGGLGILLKQGHQILDHQRLRPFQARLHLAVELADVVKVEARKRERQRHTAGQQDEQDQLPAKREAFHRWDCNEPQAKGLRHKVNGIAPQRAADRTLAGLVNLAGRWRQHPCR